MNNTLYTKTLPHPDFEQLEVIFSAETEFYSPDNHFDFAEDINFANSDKESSWFCAEVKVQLKGTSLFGIEFLGCCSYSSFDDFLNDAYFTDMVEQATQDLINDLNETSDKINAFSEFYNKKAG